MSVLALEREGVRDTWLEMRRPRSPRPTSPNVQAVTKAFSRRLKGWREHKKKSQMDLAYPCKMSMDTVRSYEAGRRVPRLSEIALMAEILGISLSALLFKDPPPPKDG